eukprot:4511674-Pleurochrysis_carterae.AAC.3
MRASLYDGRKDYERISPMTSLTVSNHIPRCACVALFDSLRVLAPFADDGLAREGDRTGRAGLRKSDHPRQGEHAPRDSGQT